MENIIKKAIEGGYANDRPEYARQHLITGFEGDFRFMVIDPLFWQSLGKACGWEGRQSDMVDAFAYAMSARTGKIPKTVWQRNALKFHEINLTEGWDKAVEWLNGLIK